MPLFPSPIGKDKDRVEPPSQTVEGREDRSSSLLLSLHSPLLPLSSPHLSSPSFLHSPSYLPSSFLTLPCHHPSGTVLRDMLCLPLLLSFLLFAFLCTVDMCVFFTTSGLLPFCFLLLVLWIVFFLHLLFALACLHCCFLFYCPFSVSLSRPFCLPNILDIAVFLCISFISHAHTFFFISLLFSFSFLLYQWDDNGTGTVLWFRQHYSQGHVTSTFLPLPVLCPFSMGYYS